MYTLPNSLHHFALHWTQLLTLTCMSRNCEQQSMWLCVNQGFKFLSAASIKLVQSQVGEESIVESSCLQQQFLCFFARLGTAALILTAWFCIAALEKVPERTTSTTGGGAKVPSDPNEVPSLPRREARERELLNAYGQLGDANEVLNERAVAVMKRMSDKLTGRDFLQEGLPNSGDSDSVQSQVQRLIMQATAHDNLCQSYIGWCPFW